MPIHDWTTRTAGRFHNFHQSWTIRLMDALNGGLLPPGYFATTDQRIEGWESDTATDAGAYARRANRVVVRVVDGEVVAVIEIVSPGNKDRLHSVNQFVGKVRDFLRKGVHVLFVDLFPPGEHDPHGLHAAVWSAWTDTPDERPADKPLTAASYDAGNPFAAYLKTLGIGDPLPEMPLFIRPDVYVPCPLEESYMAAWNALPPQLRDDAVTGPKEVVPEAPRRAPQL